MTINDLYNKYNLMPQLREHQLRVGGIVYLLTKEPRAILTALVHDMGNIAKFSGLDEYWRGEQQKFWDQYGRDAHEATFAILREAGLDELEASVREEGDLYNNILRLNGNYDSYSEAAVYTLYGDCRVAIDGVVSAQERIVDLEKRYGSGRSDRLWVEKLEDYVRRKSGVEVAKITEQDVLPLLGTLLTYPV